MSSFADGCRLAAIRLQKLLDLFPGNQNLPQGFAACQEPSGDQAAHGFGADIQGRSGLFDVI